MTLKLDLFWHVLVFTPYVKCLKPTTAEWHHNPLPPFSPQNVGTFLCINFHTYLQKSYIQLELFPHLIKDTYVTNISSWHPCEVSF